MESAFDSSALSPTAEKAAEARSPREASVLPLATSLDNRQVKEVSFGSQGREFDIFSKNVLVALLGRSSSVGFRSLSYIVSSIGNAVGN